MAQVHIPAPEFTPYGKYSSVNLSDRGVQYQAMLVDY